MDRRGTTRGGGAECVEHGRGSGGERAAPATGCGAPFQRPDEAGLGAVTMAECERYIQQGMFPAGSMGPKVEAIYRFLERGGKRGLITSPAALREALEGRAGTHFIGRI